MKSVVIVIAVLLVLLGVVWMGQGLGFIKGSFMTGQGMWAWIGAAVIVVGAALGAASLRMKPHR